MTAGDQFVDKVPTDESRGARDETIHGQSQVCCQKKLKLPDGSADENPKNETSPGDGRLASPAGGAFEESRFACEAARPGRP